MHTYRFLVNGVRGFLFLAFFVMFSFLFVQTTLAQADCTGSVGTHWHAKVFVYDQYGQRWGSDAIACPGVNTNTWVYKNGAIPNNYVKDITWDCAEGGFFDVREYKSCGLQTLGVALAPPPGYECVGWEARNVSDNSLGETGAGCWMTFDSNQGLSDDSDKVINMRIQPFPPTNPSNLDFNCNNPGDSGRLTWTAGANTQFYALRFNNLNNGWNGSCSSPLPGDFCVNTSNTYYDYTGIDPFAEYEIWMHAVNSVGVWSSGVAMSKYMRCTPNCRIINPSGTDLADFSVPAGTSLNFTTRFTSHDGDLSGSMYVDDNLSGPANTLIPNTVQNYGASTIQSNDSFDWTAPATAGVYRIRCRAWNDARVECRAPGTTGITGNAIKACDSTNPEVMVTVTNLPPVCADPVAPTLSGLTCTNDTTPILTTTNQGVACYPHDLDLRIYSDLNNNSTADGVDAQVRVYGVNNAFNAINTSYGYTVPTALSSGTYIWRSRVSNSSGAGAVGPYSGWRGLDIDRSAPAVPNPTIALDASNRVIVSWAGVADANCGGLAPSPYWVQLSTSPTFATVWPATWNNTWQATTSQTSTLPCVGGQTYWAQVQSRDQFDNQSGWSAPVQLTCPFPNWTLNVQSSNSNGGVAITGGPVAYGGTTNYTRSVVHNSSFTLTAPAIANGRLFNDWTGCTSAAGAVCTVTNMTAARTVTANYLLPDCTVAPPQPTMTCTARPGSTTLFNTTLTWSPRWVGTPGVTCVVRTVQTFTAEVSPDTSYSPLETRTTSPALFTNNGPGYPLDTSGTPDLYGRVRADDGVTSALSTPDQQINLGCNNLPVTDIRYGACGGCPAPTLPPVSGMLQYCPQPPTL